tara:strand:- start:74 stop:253 length:180 start_codon:yes stop_codon:yes gene_type:complete
MSLPFFCAVCDKPLKTNVKNKYKTIHEECMDEYLSKHKAPTKDEFNKNSIITVLPKKPK